MQKILLIPDKELITEMNHPESAVYLELKGRDALSSRYL